MARMEIVQIQKGVEPKVPTKKEHYLDYNECFVHVTYIWLKSLQLADKIEIGTVHVLFSGP